MLLNAAAKLQGEIEKGHTYEYDPFQPLPLLDLNQRPSD